LDYIRWDTKLEGVYSLIWDDEESKNLRLDYSKLHHKVRLIEGKAYFMCTDSNAQEKQPDGLVKTNVLDIDPGWMRGKRAHQR